VQEAQVGWSEADCELCSEVMLAGTAATGAYDNGQYTPFSRLICRTSIVDAYAGLGCINPGYALIVPRRHVTSIGMLSPGEARHVFETAQAIALRVMRIFNRHVVLVEHGSSGTSEQSGRACIEHAHAHIFPVDGHTDSRTFAPYGSRHIHTLYELSNAACAGKNYYYCVSGSAMEGYFMEDPRLGSQYARRIWADLLGSPDMWDWAAFPFYDNCMTTVIELRRDVISREESIPISDSARLNETIHAYNRAADWYSSRTSGFPDGTSLKDEIKALVTATSGPILDAGAGVGRDADYFASFNRPIVALDAAFALLQHVPSKSGILPVLADIRKLPFEDQTFGAVWCSAVLVHMDQSSFIASLCELFRVLRPDGLMQISVKEGSGYSAQTVAQNRSLRRHFYFYEADEVMAMAHSVGFEILSCWTEDESDASDTIQRWVKFCLRRPGH
jgi:SAM-dependent methyltransferase/diadenosine tetraphosphate (Ap4A) HIT family hydrolase